MNVIPAIDMRNGRCVRLYQGDFDRETEYGDDPVAVARRFETLGCSQLHVVDLDGARSGEQHNRTLVRQIAAETGFDVQVGGGIRDVGTLAGWLDVGVHRCVVGSIAIEQPDTVIEWLRRYGSERIVLALDVRIDDAGVPNLATHGWTRNAGIVLWACVDDYLQAGLRHVLCTDIGRDGAMSGPNLALYGEFVTRYPHIELQASGGVRNIRDLEQLRACGASAAITGRALLDGKINKEELASFLRDA